MRSARSPRGAALALALAAAAAAVALGACGASVDAGDGSDAGPGDAGTGCSVFVRFDPMAPVATPTTAVRADAVVAGAPGVLDYTWSVTFEGGAIAHQPQQVDGSAISFPATQPGVYLVQLAVGAAISCPTVQAPLNVLAPGANVVSLRLRITPPASAGVPPFEKLVAIPGGADHALGTLALDPGVVATAAVRSGTTGVPAYLRLMPGAAKEAAVETFAGAGGGFTVRVLGQDHDVLVVPTVPGLAPRLVEDWQPSMPTIDVAAGSTVTGVVRGPSGAALAGARVQLKIGEVPSTVATSAANGTFTLLAEVVPGKPVTVDVTPPDGSGLPRLAAVSAALNLAQQLQIDYAPSLSLRDLAGARIRRGGTAVAGAKVVVVGTLAAAGAVSTGGAPVSATGAVRVAVTANGSGVLPAALAPARPLSAVVEVAPNDHAVAAIDLTSATPADIDAPPAIAVATLLRRPGGTPIEGAVLDAVPVGALALAGVTSAVRARSGASGQVAASLAAGGRYDLRLHDPALARGAPAVARDVTAQTIAASYALEPALVVTGTLLQQGSPTPLGGAAVQLLCTACSGLDRDRPIAEGTSRPDGAFTLVIPDPGTN